ncbi:MAG TPA: TetR/AcrR family transcriptional regulator [Candidatus Cloacimonetes bacterium]|nr:TetR/AcrR family transcriptional regulator [Candidatus Cloacimonadota bacterium]HEX37947.1 TetR/AcrR family transcriptional regulator [Candidatus Cloacimonadota bacterium]
MARIVKKHDIRKNEILDMAQTLFYTQGYEKTSINQIIDHLGIAKGTIYHYFKSKYELLDAVVERLILQMREAVIPIIQNEDMNAIEKFNMTFKVIGQIKLEKKEFMLELLRVMNREENIILRHKMITRSIDLLAPIIADFIKQGNNEGLCETEYPLESAQYILAISNYLNIKLSQIIIEIQEKKQDISVLIDNYAAYERAIERIIGAAENSISLADRTLIEQFFSEEE